jgi:hypothetical protein
MERHQPRVKTLSFAYGQAAMLNLVGRVRPIAVVQIIEKNKTWSKNAAVCKINFDQPRLRPSSELREGGNDR